MLYTLGLLSMIASSLAKTLPPTAEGAAVAKTSGRGLREMFPGWDFDTKLPSPWDSSGNWVGVTLSPVVPGTETETLEASNLAEPGAKGPGPYGPGAPDPWDAGWVLRGAGSPVQAGSPQEA